MEIARLVVSTPWSVWMGVAVVVGLVVMKTMNRRGCGAHPAEIEAAWHRPLPTIGLVIRPEDVVLYTKDRDVQQQLKREIPGVELPEPEREPGVKSRTSFLLGSPSAGQLPFWYVPAKGPDAE